MPFHSIYMCHANSPEAERSSKKQLYDKESIIRNILQFNFLIEMLHKILRQWYQF